MQEHDIAIQVALNNQRIDLMNKDLGEFKVEIKGSLDRNNEVLKELHDKIDNMILSLSVTAGKHEERLDETSEKIKTLDTKVNAGVGALFTVFVTLLGAAASYFLK